VAIAPRFLTGIIKPGQLPLGTEIWEDTSLKLAHKNWQNLIDNQTIVGENLAVGEILQNFPVALLIGS
jgi:(1->4)-alpha-D-glucan 1-alpha-D-glucosylmutase